MSCGVNSLKGLYRRFRRGVLQGGYWESLDYRSDEIGKFPLQSKIPHTVQHDEGNLVSGDSLNLLHKANDMRAARLIDCTRARRQTKSRRRRGSRALEAMCGSVRQPQIGSSLGTHDDMRFKHGPCF